MSDLVWHTDPPPLRAPILVTAFEGWFDVGGAATGAVEWLSERATGTHVAHVDPDPYFDFSERRPFARLEGGVRVIDWPANDVHTLALPDRGRDLVLMVGVEPHLRWRGFADLVLEVAERCRAALLVTLGATIAEVPHTRPFVVAGSTVDPHLAGALGLDRPSYEGPTGVVGVLHDLFTGVGVPAVSLRVSVPHYVAGTPNPKGSRALLERFERVTGLPTDWAELDRAAEEWEARVNEAMNDDDDVLAYVRGLEQASDTRMSRELPSAEDLAAEFERFLRRQRPDEGRSGG
ncbi:MAG: PAC2 family protein [Acidimicrobiales bacterium]